jgi:hypothetical protein
MEGNQSEPPAQAQPQQINEFKKGVTILLATPCYGGLVHQGYMQSVLTLQRICDKIGWNLIVKTHGNESLIPRGRNLYVAMTLGFAQITHLLYIDADITFNAEAIVRMVQEDRDVTAGIYPKKGINWGKVRDYARDHPDVDPTKLENVCSEYVLNMDGGNVPIQRGFIRIKYAGTGMLLIKRSVIEKLIEAYPETKYVNDIQGYDLPELRDNFYALFDCIIHPESRRYLSEDYLFCERWHKIGGEIWADLSANLTHTGTYDFKGNFAEFIMANIRVDQAQPQVHEPQEAPVPVPEPQTTESQLPTTEPPKEEAPKRVKFINSI